MLILLHTYFDDFSNEFLYSTFFYCSSIFYHLMIMITKIIPHMIMMMMIVFIEKEHEN
jgi:hypothetical protein